MRQYKKERIRSLRGLLRVNLNRIESVSVKPKFFFMSLKLLACFRVDFNVPMKNGAITSNQRYAILTL